MTPSDTRHNETVEPGFHFDPELPRRAHLMRLAEQAERNRAALRESDRARFWFATKVAAICMVGCLTGLVPMAWAMHTTDVESAQLAWAVGPVLGQTIILVTLLVAWIRWQRDEW